MNFEKALKELKLGRRIRRKAWEPLQHLNCVGGRINAYRGETYRFEQQVNDFLSDDWFVVGDELKKQLTFVEALEELRNRKFLRRKQWDEMNVDDYAYIFVDTDGELAICHTVPYVFMPNFKDLCALDWEVMK